MMTKKARAKNWIFLAGFSVVIGLLMVVSLVRVDSVFSQGCPSNTQVGETQATLVGEITDDGGDPNLEVWFQYGKTTSYGYETSHQSKYGLGLFCATVYNLEPCTTYNYRAVAKNSAGTSYGGNQSFTTTCLPVSVDLKANNSNGPITVSYQSNVTLSWTSENAVSCQASGDWSGTKAVSGSQIVQMNQVKTYTFTLTCKNSTGTKTSADSVTVKVTANPPAVITKPAVVTY